jgi:hypothetical protein
MPEKTKRNKDFENAAKKQKDELPVEQRENNEKDTWESDQQDRGYYYDDSYGYEIYNPDQEDED